MNSGFASDDFKNKWTYEQAFNRTDGISTVKTKLFKRYLWIGDKPIGVAETTFTYLKNPQDKILIKELATTIKASFPKNILSSHDIENGIILEGHLKKINRFIRIDLIKKNNQVIIISSLVRFGLKNVLMPEIKQMHSVLQTYNGETDQKTSFLNYFHRLIINEAEADTLSTGAQALALLNGSNITGTNGTNISTLATTMNTVSGTINGTNTAIASVGTGLDGLNTQAEQLNNNLALANQTAANQAQQLNNTLANANQTAATQGQQFNDNWAASNKVAAQMMDPGHMGKLAFYSAAGAALGTLAIGLAADGVANAASLLYELFTGTKKKKLEWQDFEKAMGVWDSEESNLIKMEIAVDNLILAFDFFQDKNIGNDYLTNLKNNMQEMSFDRDMLMEKFQDKTQALECRRVFHNAAEELTSKLKEYDKLLEFAEKNKIVAENKESYFCGQLKDIERRILMSEAQMQDLRLAILKAESQFYTKDNGNKDKALDDINEVNNNLADTIKNRENFDQINRDRLINEYNANRDAWAQDCVDQKNAEGLKIRADLGFFGHLFNGNKNCQALYEKNFPIKLTDSKIAETFKIENNLRENLSLKPNTIIDFKLSEDQMNWFTRIHMDAYCYQFAHKSKEEVPAKCNEFPEMLYSINMAKGHDKAAAVYKDKCEGQYIAGIKKLANK